MVVYAPAELHDAAAACRGARFAIASRRVHEIVLFSKDGCQSRLQRIAIIQEQHAPPATSRGDDLDSKPSSHFGVRSTAGVANSRKGTFMMTQSNAPLCTVLNRDAMQRSDASVDVRASHGRPAKKAWSECAITVCETRQPDSVVWGYSRAI